MRMDDSGEEDLTTDDGNDGDNEDDAGMVFDEGESGPILQEGAEEYEDEHQAFLKLAGLMEKLTLILL
ncbi:hypothetical protein CDL15_Pgr010456 [Punica granatum]|uniref:Uncharacterized protein n=1 Tax=Punica granatum TaxID=22663 RepID=A0A218VWV0_PUNGR|nr:hypothetical protein CDL15_Pgr010456 [Punica granatum]